MPAKEWPTSTVGPCCRASASCVASTPACSVVNGFCTDVTWIPFGWSRAMTSDQHDPSAKRPCTRTTLRTLGAGCAAAARCKSGLAAPATTMLTKVRRSIGLLHSHLPLVIDGQFLDVRPVALSDDRCDGKT